MFDREISTRAGIWTVLGVTAVLIGIIHVQYTGIPHLFSYEKPETHVLTNRPTIIDALDDWMNELVASPIEPMLIDNGRTYRSRGGRFSLMIPKQVIEYNAACAQSGSLAKTYPGIVDVGVFEKKDSVVIAPAKHFEVSEDGSTCIEVLHSPENVSDAAYYKWTVYPFPARNEEDITKWMQEHVGAGCEITGTVLSPYEGTEMLAMSMNLESSEKPCYTNVINYMFFNRSKGRAVYVRSGQEPTFLWDDTQDSSYESAMLASFRIE